MKAIRVTALTGPDDVELAEVERPSPGPEQVLIEVACAGVTFPELLQTRGMYQTKHELPFVLGSEASGIVAEAGPGSRFSVGDRVAAITGVGTFAEYLVADDASTMALPDTVGLAQGAGMPMNVLTADFALRVRADARPGQSVLVHGAAGGRAGGLGHGPRGSRGRLVPGEGRSGARPRGEACRQGRWLQGCDQGDLSARGRLCLRSGRRRSLHRLHPCALALRTSAGSRFHRRRDPRDQGQQAAAEEHLG